MSLFFTAEVTVIYSAAIMHIYLGVKIKFLDRITSHLFFHILWKFHYHLREYNGEITF
jgi:hypothetical protein